MWHRPLSKSVSNHYFIFLDLLKGKRKRSEQPEEDHLEGDDNESYNTIQFKRAGFSKYQKTDQDFQPQKSTLPPQIENPVQ